MPSAVMSSRRHPVSGHLFSRSFLGAVAVVVFPAGAATATAQPADLQTVLARTASYVNEYRTAFAEIVGTEHYQQTVRRPRRRGPVMRHVESEMFFAAVGGTDGPWMTIRNVLEVDGRPVPDTHQRIVDALSATQLDRTAQLRALAQEGARFNIGDVRRTFNDPTLALTLMAAELQPRFRFTLDGVSRRGAYTAYRLRFVETARPSLIRDPQDEVDTDLSGYVDVTADGQVLATELRVSLASRTTSRISVQYARNAQVDLMVPISMDEDYRNDNGPGRGLTLISCAARYSNYRRFRTSVRVLPQ